MIIMGKFVTFFVEREFRVGRKHSRKMETLYMLSGIVISVAALMIALALFSGYEKTLKDVILGVNSHCYVFRFGNRDITEADHRTIGEFLSGKSEVAAVGAAVNAQAMAVQGRRTKAVTVRGIDTGSDNLPTHYHRFVREGRSVLENDREAVIGVKLMKEMGLELGDTLKVVSPLHPRMTPLGLTPKSARFKLVGIYESGMYEYDSTYLITQPGAAAQFTMNPEEYSWLEIKLKPESIDNADVLATRWEDELNENFQSEDNLFLGAFRIASWKFYNGNLFSLITLEKWILFIIMSFMVLIASFNVVSGVLTSILEKKRDIGILKAYGATSGMIKRIFMGRTVYLTAIAVLCGEALGFVLGHVISRQTIYQLKGDVYFLEKLNVSFSLEVWVIVFVVAMVIVFLTSLIPLRRIETMSVSEILRNSPGK